MEYKQDYITWKQRDTLHGGNVLFGCYKWLQVYFIENNRLYYMDTFDNVIVPIGPSSQYLTAIAEKHFKLNVLPRLSTI